MRYLAKNSCALFMHNCIWHCIVFSVFIAGFIIHKKVIVATILRPKVATYLSIFLSHSIKVFELRTRQIDDIFFSSEQSNAVDWLIRYGANVSQVDKEGWTPLHWAVTMCK